MSDHDITVTVNGAPRRARVPSRLLLVHLLRDVLRMTGTKVGCDTTNCGACTVLLDGRSVKSCTVLAVQADGAVLTTVEGLASSGGERLQDAFHREHALQCGYCTPGMLMAAMGLIRNAPGSLDDGDVRTGLEGNLCRCTGYETIVRAVQAAAGSSADEEEGGRWT